jgi:hypothetical protein
VGLVLGGRGLALLAMPGAAGESCSHVLQRLASTGQEARPCKLAHGVCPCLPIPWRVPLPAYPMPQADKHPRHPVHTPHGTAVSQCSSRPVQQPDGHPP